jgi:hypothetical protein
VPVSSLVRSIGKADCQVKAAFCRQPYLSGAVAGSRCRRKSYGSSKTDAAQPKQLLEELMLLESFRLRIIHVFNEGDAWKYVDIIGNTSCPSSISHRVAWPV